MKIDHSKSRELVNSSKTDIPEDAQEESTESSDQEPSREEEQNTGPRKIICKPYHWDFEDHIDEYDSYTEIKISGHTLNNETVYIVVEDFRPYLYLQLPTGKIGSSQPIKWTKAKRKALFNHFRDTMKHRGPLAYTATSKKNVYYEDPMLTLRMTFRTRKDMLTFASKIRDHRGVYVPSLSRRFPCGSLKVHEHNIDPILKFTAQRNLPLADWLECTEVPIEDSSTAEDRKFSTASVDVKASEASFKPHKPEKEMIIIRYKLMSFDIECYSKNHNSKKPDPHPPENVVFSIACTVCTDGDVSSRNKILLSLFDPHDQNPEVINQIIRFPDEKALIKGFAKLVIKEDPDAFITYNGMEFDWDYLITRAKQLGILSILQKISRIPRKECPIKTSSWSSSAYGEQNFNYMDPEGRLNIDVLTEIRRNFKLNKYNLDFVSENFLKAHKDPISPRQLFMLYELTYTLLEEARKLPPGEVPKKDRVAWKKRIQTILKKRWCTGPSLDLRQKLMRFQTSERLVWLIRQALTLTGTYNVRDTTLPLDLADKLGLTVTMEQTSNIMTVPMSYLHTRGQQIKVLAQIHRDTIQKGLIIPFIPRDEIIEEKYMGATVIDVVPGNYDDILIFDFESLYPSMMITANICYTTLLKEGDPTPDSECNVVPRSEHRGCLHDKSGKKVKAEDVLCIEKIYRFKKVIYLPNGDRLNEGLMPALERKLMASRKVVKREMAKIDAKIACATGKATDKDREFFKSQGWETPEPGSLTPDQLDVLKMYSKVLNARQLSLKVSANSAYGMLGAQKGFIPFVPGASAVTAMGREVLRQAIKYIVTTFIGEVRDGKVVGKSKLVYGDTDSCLIQRLGLDTKELWPEGVKMSKSTTHFLKCWWLKIDVQLSLTNPKDGKSYRLDAFPRGKDDENIKLLKPEDASLLYSYLGCPINLQIEAYYKRLLLLTKKRYMTYMANGEGKIIGKNKKGTIEVRREQSQWVKDTYVQASVSILEKESKELIIDNLLKRNYELFSGQVQDASFIMYKGISSVISYAKTDKSGNYIDREGNVIRDPEGPLDPRLVYAALAHVNLARKMIARGDDVPPNTRMEYVYLRDPEARCDSDRTEDYTFYRENKMTENLKIDHFYYQEQLIKPMTELLGVVFPGQPIIYEDLEVSIKKEMLKQDQMALHKINQMPSKSQYSPPRINLGVLVGDQALGKKLESRRPLVYKYSGVAAQYQNILRSFQLGLTDENHLQEEDASDLKNLVLRWKSNYILKKMFKKYKGGQMKKHRPTNRNRVLLITSKGEPRYMMLANDVKKHPRGTIVKMIEKVDIDPRVPPRPDRECTFVYTVETESGELLKDLNRDDLAPYYLRDQFLMKDLHLAYLTRSQVHEEILLSLEDRRNALDRRKSKTK